MTMLQDFIGANDISFLLGLILSLFAGFLIGVERESRGKDAGISTHMLVISGSMLFTLISFTVDPASPSRIAANIITGIGFLGAGVILRAGAHIKNLTTAASIWFAASIGMAFGFGYYFIGIVATIASIIIPRIPNISGKSPESKIVP